MLPVLCEDVLGRTYRKISSIFGTELPIQPLRLVLLTKTVRKIMDGIQEIDTVFQFVRQAAKRIHFPADTAIAQQILLLGDAFYGYRFTAMDFRAVWSAADQTLKVFDADGRVLDVCQTANNGTEAILFPAVQRKAA
jgi:hypothetical protein